MLPSSGMDVCQPTLEGQSKVAGGSRKKEVAVVDLSEDSRDSTGVDFDINGLPLDGGPGKMWNYVGETSVEVEKITFLWTIRSWSTTLGSVGEDLMSPPFRGGTAGHLWQLRCGRRVEGATENVRIHVILSEYGKDAKDSTKVKARFRLSVLGVGGKLIKAAGDQNMKTLEFRKGSIWGYDRFASIRELGVKGLEDEAAMKIHCVIWIDCGLKTSIRPTEAILCPSPETKKRKAQERLASDFGKLLKESSNTDLALVTSSGKRLRVHKAVLLARSSVFSALFRGKLAVGTEVDTVEVLDFSDDIVESMVSYMYSGELPQISKEPTELLQIASKFDLPGLKEACEEEIGRKIGVENATVILNLSTLYDANLLKAKVVHFIKNNKEEVIQTESFQRMADASNNPFVELFLAQD